MRHLLRMTCLMLGLALCESGVVQGAAESDHRGKQTHSAAAHDDKGEGPGKNPKNAFLQQLAEQGIWTIVVFLVLFFILGKTAWKPMLEGLQRREATIRTALEEAQKAREEARELREKYDAEMKRAAENAREIIEQARRDATRLMEEERAKLKSEIAAERDRLHRELNLAKDQALHEMWQQATQLATLIASKAIRRQINVDDQRVLLDEALNEMRGAVEDRREFTGGKA